MTNNLGWEFMLNGNTQEFRELSTRPCSAYFNIYGGIDHWLDCPNDDFRMNTLYCEDESEPSSVWRIGYELISLFNGASVLFDRDFRKVSVFRLLHDGNDVPYEAPLGYTGLLGKPSFLNQQRLDEEFKKAKITSIKLQLIHLATENLDAYLILKYLDLGQGWVNYYKLLETIQSFAKEKNVDLTIDKAKKNFFHNTANNFSLSGIDSRHGFKEIIKQNNTPSMTIEEGHAFVTDVAKTYFNTVYNK